MVDDQETIVTYDSGEDMIDSWHFRTPWFKKYLYYPAYRTLDSWRRSIKCFFTRPTTVKPPWLGHYYMDMDGLAVHLVFACLSRFIDNEWHRMSNGNDDDECERSAAWTELKSHHLWFHEKYLPFYNGDGDGYKTAALLKHGTPEWRDALQKAYETECEMEKEITRRAMRVIELRDYMWT